MSSASLRASHALNADWQVLAVRAREIAAYELLCSSAHNAITVGVSAGWTKSGRCLSFKRSLQWGCRCSICDCCILHCGCAGDAQASDDAPSLDNGDAATDGDDLIGRHQRQAPLLNPFLELCGCHSEPRRGSSLLLRESDRAVRDPVHPRECHKLSRRLDDRERHRKSAFRCQCPSPFYQDKRIA